MSGSAPPPDTGVPTRTGSRRRKVVWGTVALLVASGIGVAWYFSLPQVLLFRAIRTDNLDLVRIMLRVGADPNRILDDDTPLTAALHRPYPPSGMARLLLEYHADPNRPSSSGRTPLGSLWHSQAGNVWIEGPEASAAVDILVTAGANIKACNGKHSLLESPGSVEFARFLLSRGADVNQVCDPSCARTPLHYAVERPDLVALYLDHGAKNAAESCDGRTPLHQLAYLDSKDRPEHPHRSKSAEILLTRGAEVNAVSKQGMTALDYAFQNGSEDLAALLIKHGGKALKHASLEAGQASHAAQDEYQDLYMFPEGRGKEASCSLSLVGENRNTMEEGPNWSIMKGTVGVVRVNCHASGYFHYAVLGMGPPVRKRLNMPLLGARGGSAKINFDENWTHAMMRWYYSSEPITNLVKALNQGKATHFAVRYVTVGE